MHLLVLVVVLGLQLHDLPASRGPGQQASQPVIGGVVRSLSRGSHVLLMGTHPPPKGPKVNNSSLDTGQTAEPPRCKQTRSLTQIAFRGGGPSSGPRREAWPRGYGTATRVWRRAWPRGPTRTPLAWSRAQTCFLLWDNVYICMYVSSSPADTDSFSQTPNKNGRGFWRLEGHRSSGEDTASNKRGKGRARGSSFPARAVSPTVC